MKRFTVGLLGLFLVLSLAACGKQPVEEISATRAALDGAITEGAQKYTPEDLKLVNDRLNAAMEEVKVQDGKMFKDYETAKQMLAKTKADADALKDKVARVKERMKSNAIDRLNEAAGAVADATTALETAPVGKGSLADIEAMKADVAGLGDALTEIQPLIDAGEFGTAAEKAKFINSRALTVIAEIQEAQEKVALLKKK